MRNGNGREKRLLVHTSRRREVGREGEKEGGKEGREEEEEEEEEDGIGRYSLMHYR